MSGLRNIPVLTEGFKFMIVEAPTMKLKKNDKTGELVPHTNYKGVQLFVVTLFAKPLPNSEGYAGKGEEIKVTLSIDPGDDFAEGQYVSLVSATVSPWKTDNGAGLSWSAEAIAPHVPMRAAA